MQLLIGGNHSVTRPQKHKGSLSLHLPIQSCMHPRVRAIQSDAYRTDRIFTCNAHCIIYRPAQGPCFSLSIPIRSSWVPIANMTGHLSYWQSQSFEATHPPSPPSCARAKERERERGRERKGERNLQLFTVTAFPKSSGLNRDLVDAFHRWQK